MKYKKAGITFLCLAVLTGGVALFVTTRSQSEGQAKKRLGSEIMKEIGMRVAEEEKYLRAGQSLIDQGEYTAAISQLMNLKNVGGPSWSVATAKISRAYESLGDYGSALTYLEEHLKNAPDWAIERHADRLKELRQKAGLPASE